LGSVIGLKAGGVPTVVVAFIVVVLTVVFLVGFLVVFTVIGFLGFAVVLEGVCWIEFSLEGTGLELKVEVLLEEQRPG